MNKTGCFPVSIGKRRTPCALLRMILAGFMFCSILIAGAITVFAENVILVDDGAGLLSSSEEEGLYKRISSLSELIGLDVMIVTTNDAKGYSSEKYADHYYLDHYKNDDGVLYLIDMDNREIHISTSGIMIYYLTDKRIEKCLDDGYDYISKEMYASCFQVMIDDTASYVKSGEGADYYRDRDTGEITWINDPREKRITLFEGIIALAAGLLAGGGTMLGVFGKYRMHLGGYSYDYKKNHKLELTNKSDIYRTKRVTTRHIPKSSGGSSGGGSGGGSTTHSTGGHSFGGGGGHW